MLYIFIFILISMILISYIIQNKIYIQTSSMAIVMALGISMHGVLSYFFSTSFVQGTYARFFLTVVLAIWMTFIFSIYISYRDGKFTTLHLTNPINRFGIGTWIAASSICMILISTHIPQAGPWLKILAIVNILFWIYYIGISIRAYFEIHKKHLYENSHGIFLLTTVSTQSIVLLLHYVFSGVPNAVIITLLSMGLLFYFLGTFFIIKRYFTRSWSIENDWKNTNCILHGALSISGLASVLSGAIDERIILVIWIATVIIFVFVEFIELYRMHERIEMYGIKKGVLTFDVSQWSRVFTFGMFYTFTSYVQVPVFLLNKIQSIVLQFGAWVVISMILVEVMLGVRDLVNEKKVSIKQDQRVS